MTNEASSGNARRQREDYRREEQGRENLQNFLELKEE